MNTLEIYNAAESLSLETGRCPAECFLALVLAAELDAQGEPFPLVPECIRAGQSPSTLNFTMIRNLRDLTA